MWGILRRLLGARPQTVFINEPSARPGSTVVQRTLTPLHRERGWKLQNGVLVGWYRTPFGSFAGRIEHPYGQQTFYVRLPPIPLLRGEHSACFTETSKNLYRIHWNKPPADLDAGIRWVEHTISEACLP